MDDESNVLAVVQAIWSEILQTPAAGPDANFFALGGHSLLALRLAARVSEAFDVDVPMATVLEHPGLAEFAGAVRVAVRERDGVRP